MILLTFFESICSSNFYEIYRKRENLQHNDNDLSSNDFKYFISRRYLKILPFLIKNLNSVIHTAPYVQQSGIHWPAFLVPTYQITVENTFLLYAVIFIIIFILKPNLCKIFLSELPFHSLTFFSFNSISFKKRIIISNVSPSIPNEDIISHLKDLNIQTLSQITHINAGFNIAELAHIFSFRRQVYINPDDFLKFPGSLLINHENTHHRIFLSDDTLFCYLCKPKGHTSKQCKNPPSEAPNTKLYEVPVYNKSKSDSN
ncbi:DNA replication licensing factor MCM4-like, partial [Aphis craccivora]